MRLRTLIPIGIVGGVAIYALRNTKHVRRRFVTPLVGTAGSALAHARYRVERLATPSMPAERMAQLDAEAGLDDTDVELVVSNVMGPRPVGADIGDAIDEGLANLIEAERELMTVDGDEHRRRDQTSGAAAQEIAAAQVRARRNGVDEDDFDSDSFT